jgi:RNA polymerase sigma factor (sigma-70 family)
MPPSEAFEVFFADDFPRLVGFLITMGYGSGLAQECAAEAMLKAHERWLDLDQPRAWVRKVASRMALQEGTRDVDGVRRAVEGGWAQATLSPDPTRIVEARLQREELLKGLPDRQREVMAWTFDGFEPTEIADALGLPPETVRSNLRHAREKLKKKFKQMNPHSEGGA